jgi:hypothetical protein
MNRALFLAACLFAALAVGGTQAAALAADKALTNGDVVTLVKAGFGDALVIQKIEGAPSVDFDVATETLVKLKQNGISQAVIGAMLKRSSSAPAGANTPAAVSGVGGAPATGNSTVRLVTTQGTLDLVKMNGTLSHTGLGMKTFHEFGGAAAHLRTRDAQPTILIASTSSPQGQYYVVKTEPNSKKQKRSVKIGSGMLGMHGSTSPDEDWTVPYECTQSAAGIWRLQLSKSLEPGEYGVYISSQNQLTAGDLFDFGVD